METTISASAARTIRSEEDLRDKDNADVSSCIASSLKSIEKVTTLLRGLSATTQAMRMTMERAYWVLQESWILLTPSFGHD